jgi:hypothetical protein
MLIMNREILYTPFSTLKKNIYIFIELILFHSTWCFFIKALIFIANTFVLFVRIFDIFFTFFLSPDHLSNVEILGSYNWLSSATLY